MGPQIPVFAFFILLSLLFAGGATIVVSLVLAFGRRRQAAFESSEGVRELRDEMRDMHQSLEARLADITLMLDEIQQRQLPPSDDAR